MKNQINRDIKLLSLFIAGIMVCGTGFQFNHYLENQKNKESWGDQQVKLFFSPLIYACDGEDCVNNAEINRKELAEKEKIETEKEYFKKISDKMVGEINKQFDSDKISWITPIAFCLLRNESGFGTNDSLGDGGLAGGILQFHENTYKHYRQEMINMGLASEVGSRFNDDTAIETAVYMWKNGELEQWGPYNVGECR